MGDALGDSPAVLVVVEPVVIVYEETEAAATAAAEAWAPKGEVSGVCGLRKIIASGELGAELGVSGLFGMRRTE